MKSISSRKLDTTFHKFNLPKQNFNISVYSFLWDISYDTSRSGAKIIHAIITSKTTRSLDRIFTFFTNIVNSVLRTIIYVRPIIRGTVLVLLQAPLSFKDLQRSSLKSLKILAKILTRSLIESLFLKILQRSSLNP